MKRYFLLLQSFIFFLSVNLLYSQQEGWSVLNLGHTISSPNKYAVGGTCLIFAEPSSKSVFGFNIYSGKWSSLKASTTLPWTDVYANGNTAMILNDSVAVFYSAHQGNFTQLRFEGHIINVANKWAGCKDNYCYLVTDTKIYIFDAEDSQIRSLAYSGVGTYALGHLESSGDYFVMGLSNTSPYAATFVAYSTITKTISEYVLGAMAEQGLNSQFLDHGFVVNSIGGPPFYCLCYSAFTGEFIIKTCLENLPFGISYFSGDPACVNKKICALLTFRGPIDKDGMTTLYLWPFNTLTGTFDEYKYSYNVNKVHTDISAACGEGALHSYYDEDSGNKINVVIYNAHTRAFTEHDFNFTYNYRNTYNFGGHVIAIATMDKIIFYDFVNGKSANYPSDWKVGDFPAIQDIKPGNEYIVTVYRDPAETDNTKFKILSFNGSTGLIKSVSYTPQSYYSTIFAAGNYSIVFLTNPSQPYSNIIYSAVQDKWITKSMTTGVTSGYKNAFCFHRYKNENITEIFDAGTGNETTIPTYPSTVYPSQMIFRDSIFGMFGTDQKLYGFSTFNNSLASSSVNYYSNIQSDRMIFYFTPVTTPAPNHILFDANLGKYVSLTTTDQTHGTGIHIVAGMKTALRAFSKGFLFAYNPNSVGIADAPLVTATASQYAGEVPFSVQFNATVSGGNAPISFMWNFGDGSTSGIQNPVHNFTSPGTYIAEITVTDSDGDKGICSLVITVNDNPTAIDDRSVIKPKIYPVPAADQLIIEIPEGLFKGNHIRLSILEISGRYIFIDNKFELTESPVVLDISHIKNGIYLLEATDKIISRKMKIVKTQ